MKLARILRHMATPGWASRRRFRYADREAIRAAVARLYRKATTQELVPVFQALVRQEPCFEEHLDADYIISSWDKPKPEQEQAWQTAFEAVAGDAVLCGPSATVVDIVQRKGYAAKPIRSNHMVEAAKRFGIKTETTVLSNHEQKGREKIPATLAAQAAVNEVWGWLEKYRLTNNTPKPAVGCYREIVSGGDRSLGFCDETGVYIEADQAGGRNNLLLQTALEECVHWVTKSGDCSRDIQEFTFRMVVEVLAG